MTLSPNTFIQCLFLLILSAKTLQPLMAQAKDGDHQPPARSIALDDVTDLELAGGLTFEFVCGDRNEVSIHAAETRFYKVSRRANNLVIKQKNLQQLWSRNRGNNSVHVIITTAGAIPDLEVESGVSGSVRTCLTPQPLLQLKVATGSKIRLMQSQLGELAAKISTGSEIEIVEPVEVRQLFLQLGTGSQFYAGPKFTAVAARVTASTGSYANVCGANLVTGKVGTGSSVRVSSTATVDIKTSRTGGRVKQGAC